MKILKIAIILVIIFSVTFFVYRILLNKSEILSKSGTHIIFNGKDIGVGSNVKIVDGYYIYSKDCKAAESIGDFGDPPPICTIIFNGKKIDIGGYYYISDFGELVYVNDKNQTTVLTSVRQDRGVVDLDALKLKGNVSDDTLPKVMTFDGVNFAYIGKNLDVYYNNQIVGKVYCDKNNWLDSHVYLANGHYGFVDDQGYVIYDGKSLGKGMLLRLSGDNFGYIDSERYVIYNGERGKLGNLIGDDGYVNELDRGCYGVILSGDNYGYRSCSGFIIYNSKMVGFGDNLLLAKNNYGFITKEGHVVYNGNDKGEGYGLQLSGDSYAFYRDVK